MGRETKQIHLARNVKNLPDHGNGSGDQRFCKPVQTRTEVQIASGTWDIILESFSNITSSLRLNIFRTTELTQHYAIFRDCTEVERECLLANALYCAPLASKLLTNLNSALQSRIFDHLSQVYIKS